MKEKEEDLVLTLRGREIVIIYNLSDASGVRPWENNGIFIYDQNKSIKHSEVIVIIEYLYEEGFIDDRRTPYEILGDEN